MGSNAAMKKEPATYQDIVDLPGNIVGQIIDGELYTHSRPTARHSRAASSIGGRLFSPFDEGREGPGGWIILDEPELHIERDIVVPDLAGWKTSTMAVIPDQAFFTIVPDWTAEVLSPSTTKLDRLKKLPLYASWKVQYAWVVDPGAKILEAFRLEKGQWLLAGVYSAEVDARIEPFEAIPFDVTLLWGRMES